MESIYLLSSEDVSKAASSMRQAATEMQASAYNITEAYDQHQRFLDDWLLRFQQMLEAHKDGLVL